MPAPSQRHRRFRIVLFAVLVCAVGVLIAAAAVVVPILTHQSSGESGQQLPEGYPSEAGAVGDDGRERHLRVEAPDGEPADLSTLEPGDELVISGSGFDASIGIYVGFCGIPIVEGEKPGPCLGSIPEHAEGDAAPPGADGEPLASAWVTDDWAWRNFATHRFQDPGEGRFEVTLTVPASADEGLDCRVERCAIATRADHTASQDRVQDMLLPIAFDG